METMTAPKPPTKPTPKQPNALAAEFATMPGLPIRELHFSGPVRTLPYLSSQPSGMIRVRETGKTDGHAGLAITLIATKIGGLFRFDYKSPGQPERTFYVSTDGATFEPLE